MINPPAAGQKLEVRGSPGEGFFIDNLSNPLVKDMQEMWTILQRGESNRSQSGHALNERSSRSHAILTIEVESQFPNQADPNQEPEIRLGKLVFVDLAGSENVKATDSKGVQLTETKKINKSLLALSK